MYKRLGDLLPHALGRLKVARPVEASKVCETVTSVLGDLWDHAVPMRAIVYRNGVVTVAVTSSGWSHEVLTKGEEIKAAANQRLGQGTIKLLKTRVSPSSARGDESV